MWPHMDLFKPVHLGDPSPSPDPSPYSPRPEMFTWTSPYRDAPAPHPQHPAAKRAVCLRLKGLLVLYYCLILFRYYNHCQYVNYCMSVIMRPVSWRRGLALLSVENNVENPLISDLPVLQHLHFTTDNGRILFGIYLLKGPSVHHQLFVVEDIAN